MSVPVSYGLLPVGVLGHPRAELRLVVVMWSKGGTMLLLPTLRTIRSRKNLRQVFEGCLARWCVEGAIRFVE